MERQEKKEIEMETMIEKIYSGARLKRTASITCPLVRNTTCRPIKDLEQSFSYQGSITVS